MALPLSIPSTAAATWPVLEGYLRVASAARRGIPCAFPRPNRAIPVPAAVRRLGVQTLDGAQ